MNKNDLTQGSVLKKLLLFVLPIFGANVLQAMYGTVDLIVVGYFSDSSAVSAVASSLGVFVLIGLILTLLVPLLARRLSVLMNAPTEAIDQTVSYITVCGLGILAIIFFNVISGMFRGIGDSKSPFILMMISCVINIIGDVLLVGLL